MHQIFRQTGVISGTIEYLRHGAGYEVAIDRNAIIGSHSNKRALHLVADPAEFAFLLDGLDETRERLNVMQAIEQQKSINMTKVLYDVGRASVAIRSLLAENERPLKDADHLMF